MKTRKATGSLKAHLERMTLEELNNALEAAYEDKGAYQVDDLMEEIKKREQRAMSVFTDDDLKRLKDGLDDFALDYPEWATEIVKLLARLKAAEAFAEIAWEQLESGDEKLCDRYYAWRKAVGE